MICCACRCETDKIEAYDDHDDLCTLAKYRCNQYECPWCDLVDCGIGEKDPAAQKLLAATKKSSVTGINHGWHPRTRISRPRLPTIEALDLSTPQSEYSGDHGLQVSDT